MPKKFGTNTKSAEARSRKEAAKLEEKARKEKEAEDALWAEDDKHVLRKQQRKEEQEKRRQEALAKKQASRQAYEEEMSSIKSAKPAPTKVTRAEIADLINKQQEKPKQDPMYDEKPLEENVNRIIVEGDVARSIDEAIAVLSVKDQPLDQHPERRVKAAYQAFEEKNLPHLKAENPNLRLSQLKQILKKDWMKSPENPMNQRHAAYNTKIKQ